MSFLYPAFLYALGVVLIPIVIHLFNFRRFRTVYFSNVAFLQGIKQDTRSRSQLKHWLILLMRVLMLVALVLAFAKPYLPVGNNQLAQGKEEAVFVYVDNSFSMEGQSREGKLLDVAKNRAFEIAGSFKPSTKFLLITNDFEPKHAHLVGRQQFVDFLTDVSPSPVVRPASKVYTRLLDLLQSLNNSNKLSATVFWLSDFQQVSTDLEKLDSLEQLQVNLIVLPKQYVNNLFIDSIWFETPLRRPNETEAFFVKVSNNASESYNNIPVKLFINDSLKSIASFSIQGNSTQLVPMSYTNSSSGILHGKVELSDYPITYDNTMFFTYQVSERVNVLSIGAGPTASVYLSALFAKDDYFRFTHFSEKNIRSMEFAKQQLIIVDGLKSLSTGLVSDLVAYCKAGGAVFFTPYAKGEVSTYNTLFSALGANQFSRLDTQQTRMGTIDYDSPLYDKVFKKRQDDAELPLVAQHFIMGQQVRIADRALLTAENGHRLLVRGQHGVGQWFVASMPLTKEAGGFVTHEVFVPTVYNIALLAERNEGIYHTIGKDRVLSLGTNAIQGEELFHLVDLAGDFDFIPQQMPALGGGTQLYLDDQVHFAGNYKLLSGGDELSGVAFNYDRAESDMATFTVDELEKQLKQFGLTSFSTIDAYKGLVGKELQEISQGKQLWQLFVILALLFLGAEIAIVRFYKS